MRDVQAAFGEFGDLYVASDTNGFSSGGHAGKSEPGGRNSFTHDGAGSEGDVFGVFDDGKIKRTAIIHDLARELCGGDRLAIVGDSDDACFAHGGDVGDIFAFAADASGADGPHMDVAVGPGAVDDKASDGSVVVDRLRVRHAADNREATARGGEGAGLDGFGIFLAGFAKVDMHVDEAGSNDEAGSVENLNIGR